MKINLVKPIFYSLLLITICISCQNSPQDYVAIPESTVIQWVDPLIGTADHGHVYPGATVPFGMVQLSPDNGTAGWDWCSGYNYIDSIIVGFSHTHLSGTGIGDLYDIQVMPSSKARGFNFPVDALKNSPYAQRFNHSNEIASPGYYEVTLADGLKVELTSSERVGMHRYTFPQDATSPTVLLDLGFALNWDRPTETRIEVIDKQNIRGVRKSSGWAKDQQVYFSMQFSRPPAVYQLSDSSEVVKSNVASGTRNRGVFIFDKPEEPVLVKVALSSAGYHGAYEALQEIEGWDFDEQRKKAEKLWGTEIQKIEITSGDEEIKKIFYTSLYRTCLAPVTYSDAGGKYKGVDGNIRTAENYKRYDIFSLWDTFRAANPLHTITQPARVNDIIRSLLAHYKEYGLLPVWSLLANETNTMTGYHAVPVIVDAYMKGYRDFDVELAFEAMIKSSMQDIRGTNFYREYGYIPHDLDGQSVTKTLEYAFDDWCIAVLAGELGKEDVQEQYLKRAGSFKELFDSSTGFMRAKLKNGEWKSSFDPQYSEHNWDIGEYTEGNAWQHSWFVPHDPAGLIELHGGNENFVRKLDSLFTISSELRGDNVSSDISGLIGQYAHGNEPSHHIAYLYNYAGKPWKTQKIVREIMDSQYNDTPNGLCGNEDCGQMSAWYVFSAMGFYPVNPAQGVYVIGSPLVDRAKIKVPKGKNFTVVADYQSDKNIYIQRAELNGDPLTRSYITHDEVMQGGTLLLEMGSEPNLDLWSDPSAYPPSMTSAVR